jgi:5-methyltetrahydrofolate--homocysteine methyltransferase
VRKEFWGYAPDEALARRADRRIAVSVGARISRQPITPRGDPFPPARRWIGVRLTESLCDGPGSSVSGLYLAHPEAIISASQVERDQVEDYATRKGMPPEEAERSGAIFRRASRSC